MKIGILLLLLIIGIVLEDFQILNFSKEVLIYFGAYILGTILFLIYSKIFPKKQISKKLSMIISSTGFILSLMFTSYLSFIAIVFAGFGLDSYEKHLFKKNPNKN